MNHERRDSPSRPRLSTPRLLVDIIVFGTADNVKMIKVGQYWYDGFKEGVDDQRCRLLRSSA